MASYTYDQFRKVLRLADFNLIRSRKHETWHKIDESGNVFYVRVSHKGNKTIPKWLFKKMLEQSGISEADFNVYLRK